MRCEVRTMICVKCGNPCQGLYKSDEQDIVSSCCESEYSYKSKAEYIRDDIIKKIENNDYEGLGAIADLILAQRGAPKLNAVVCTTKTLNKQIRDKVKK